MATTTIPTSVELREYIDAVWQPLEAGRDVVVPEELHAEIATWSQPGLAEPHGQTDDRVAVVRPDGSRLHARQWDSGIWTLHRDRWNPQASPIHAVAHLSTETLAGRILSAVLVSASVGYVARRWGG